MTSDQISNRPTSRSSSWRDLVCRLLGHKPILVDVIRTELGGPTELLGTARIGGQDYELRGQQGEERREPKVVICRRCHVRVGD